jgi:Arc/MetJ family transcription regulator
MLVTRNEHMRTTIEIDNQLLASAMRCAKKRTKRATIEAALRLFIRTSKQENIRRFRGPIEWGGNPEQTRRSRIS